LMEELWWNLVLKVFTKICQLNIPTVYLKLDIILHDFLNVFLETFK
jgi:hypothetical protein